MTKEFTKIGACSLTLGSAQSVLSKNPCLNSPRRRAENTASRRPARRAMPHAMPPCTHLSLASVPTKKPSAPDTRSAGRSPSGAPSAVSSRIGPSSIRRATASMGRSSNRVASHATQSRLASGSPTTPSALTRIGDVGTFGTPTACLLPSTARSCANRRACVRCAGKTSPTRTGGPGSNSSSPSTTATRQVSFAAFSARSATGQSAFSMMTRFSCGRHSVTSFGEPRRNLHNGGIALLPSIHQGGQ